MRRIFFMSIPLVVSLLYPAIVYGQSQQQQLQTEPGNTRQGQQGQQQQPIPDPFIPFNLTGSWTLYNETSGSQSIINFSSDGSYIRNLHGNNLSGNWQSSIVVEQRVKMCPTEPKWTGQCIRVGLLIENPNSILFSDGHGGIMHLLRQSTGNGG